MEPMSLAVMRCLSLSCRPFAVLVMLISAGVSRGQNLVPNADFEALDEPCFGAADYSTELASWLAPYCTAGYPFYFNPCSGGNGIPHDNAPGNFCGYQQAHSGVAYAGLETFEMSDVYDPRSYITAQLSSPLQAGQEYCLSLYVSLADRSSFTSGSLGALFTAEHPDICDYQDTLEWAAMAQVSMSLAGVDTMNWTELTAVYVASGGEQFMTIGNWDTFFNCDTTALTWNPLFYSACYYVDDIALEQCDVGVDDLSNAVTRVFPNPADDWINVVVPEEFNGAKVEVVSISGEVVRTVKLAGDPGGLSVAGLCPGLYALRISSGAKALHAFVSIDPQ